MKQVVIKKKNLVVDEVPAPVVDRDSVLVEVAYSLISTGTELSGIKSAGKSVYKKVLEKPKKVLKAVKYLKQHGFKRTIEIAKGTATSIPLGYSCSGTVIDVGEYVTEFRLGDNIACAGAGKANHAEIALVPRNLAVRIPKGCSFKDAASVAVGAIALQGVRRADAKLGEIVAVIGLGLLGQITVQLLKAAGIRVIGFDIDKRRVNLSKLLGANHSFVVSKVDYLKKTLDISRGYGVDATIIAAASHSNEIVQQAMEITRKKGRVVVVGAVGLGLQRSPLYGKEIDFLISCSYGPGRYDKIYEEKGLDYPYAYIRWTEQRNMEEYLKLIAEGKVNLEGIIEKEYPIVKAPEAYSELNSSLKKPIGILLSYKANKKKNEVKMVTKIVSVSSKKITDRIKVALIGAGSFAKGVHLPNLQKLSKIYAIHSIADKIGTNAKILTEQYNASFSTTNFEDALNSKDVDMVIIATRHNLHAPMAIKAAKAGKAVFLEKPMAMNRAELKELVKTLEKTKVPFMVGFNRRFSPLVTKIQEVTKNRLNSMIIDYRMNAGFIPKDHWVQSEEGGGRNIGEACHIYDLFNSLTNSKVISVTANSIIPQSEQYTLNDNFVATISYEDGSLCTLTYTALGSKDYPKEKMDIYVDGCIIQINDYRELNIFGTNPMSIRNRTQDKGHLEELREFSESIVSSDGYPIPLWQLIQATETSFEVENKLWKKGN